MFAPQQQPHGPTFNAHQATLQQHQQALAPPSLREILDAFSKDGNGDRDMLMSLLASKRAEEERIASQLNYQTQLFLLAQQNQALQAAALIAQQQRLAGRGPTPSPSGDSQPLPSPSPSHFSEFGSEASTSSHRYSPYARSSGGSDYLNPGDAGSHSFRSDKLAKVNSAAKARRARGNSNASSGCSPRGSMSAPAAPLPPIDSLLPPHSLPESAPSPAAKPSVSVRDSSMSPPPVPSSSSSSTSGKRSSLSDLLNATGAAFARETVVKESFLRGGESSDDGVAPSE